MIYLIYWMLFCCFHPSQVKLAWNRFKYCMLTASKYLLYFIHFGFLILEPSWCTTVHSLKFYHKLCSFLITYFCTSFKMFKIPFISIALCQTVCVLQSICNNIVSIGVTETYIRKRKKIHSPNFFVYSEVYMGPGQ